MITKTKQSYFWVSYLSFLFAFLERVMTGVLHLRGGYIIALCLMFLSFVLNYGDIRLKRTLKSAPVVLWTLWVAYTLINWYSGSQLSEEMKDPLFAMKRVILPLGTMILVCYECVRNQKRTIGFLIALTLIYTIVGMVFRDDNIAADSRSGVVVGNNLALMACVMAFFAFLSRAEKLFSKRFFICVLVLSFAAIFYQATRKAFGGIIIIGLAYIIGVYDVRKFKNLIIYILFAVLLYVAYNYIMANTIMGERLNAIEEASASYNMNDSFFLSMMGDRSVFYILGWEVFLDHPITGIGLMNFSEYIGFHYQIHSEYMVELCENGIIGSLIFVFFNISLISLAIKSFKYLDRTVAFTCLGGIACMLFISFTAWTHANVGFFAMYGIIVAICHPQFNNQLLAGKENSKKAE